MNNTEYNYACITVRDINFSNLFKRDRRRESVLLLFFARFFLVFLLLLLLFWLGLVWSGLFHLSLFCFESFLYCYLSSRFAQGHRLNDIFISSMRKVM